MTAPTGLDRGVVVVGGGGHAKVVIEILWESGRNVLGFTDENPRAGCATMTPWLGDDSVLATMRTRGPVLAFVALGDNALRQRIGARLASEGVDLANAIHPRSVVSSSAHLGVGIAIMAGAVVNAATVVGDFAIVNTGATVDHDCRLGAACHVAPGCHLSGYIEVGERALLGVGSIVGRGRPLKVGAGATLGAGTVVVRDIEPGATWVGNPARPLSSPGALGGKSA